MNLTTNHLTFEPQPCVRRGLGLAPTPSPSSEARAYLRRLREAEMAAWDLTGGDYLRSQCVTQANRQ